MYNDLPDHLRELNTISTSPPSSAMNAETETALWEYLNNVDELWPNFGVAPSSLEHKHEQLREEVKQEGTAHQPFDLASFVRVFGNDSASVPPPGSSSSFPLPLPLSYSASTAPSTAATPAGINTSDIMPGSWSPSDERFSGVKKLKQIGAAPVEIEEDKRRRNTEASARFRAKKKEKEQALERHAKELETTLAQLNAENASLKNENKLLKAIVLGAGSKEGQEGLQAAVAAFGAGAAAKRKRDE